MLMYRGSTPIDDKRKTRRAWMASVCWELIGALVFLGALWALIILAFVM